MIYQGKIEIDGSALRDGLVILAYVELDEVFHTAGRPKTICTKLDVMMQYDGGVPGIDWDCVQEFVDELTADDLENIVERRPLLTF
jgi:hypothetical protein